MCVAAILAPFVLNKDILSRQQQQHNRAVSDTWNLGEPEKKLTDSNNVINRMKRGTKYYHATKLEIRYSQELAKRG